MMSITRLRLKNFKSFADSGDIQLAPLTLIFGRNNTGKSSLLNSLLLLRQSIESPEDRGRLSVRGPLYDAGSYQDLVHDHDVRKHIIVELSVLTERMRSIEMTLQIASDEPHPPRLVSFMAKAPDTLPLLIHRGRGRYGPYEMKIGDQVIGNEKKADFFFPVNNLLPRMGFDLTRQSVGTPLHRARAASFQAIRELTHTLGSLRAVGAFRHAPERRYDYRGRIPDQVDATGKNVAYALYEDDAKRSHPGVLRKSVNKWLREVGRVQLMPIRVLSQSARIFEIRVRDTDSGRWASFADVGFGIGQALPVLGEGLRTPEGGLFIVQEPEIHLHPDAQLGMADFLASLVVSGRRVIVETHSEHILLRIKHLILKRSLKRKELGLRPDQVSVIHVSKSKAGASHAKSLLIDDLGNIKNWPDGFMEEATEERMKLLEDRAKKMEAMGDDAD